MHPYRVRFQDTDWEQPMEGVRQKVIISGNEKLRLVEYSPALPPHWCETGHCGCVLEGRLEIEFPGGTQVFEAGDGISIPTGHEHRHQARVLSPVVRAFLVEKA